MGTARGSSRVRPSAWDQAVDRPMSTKYSNKVRNRETKVDTKLKGKVKAFTKFRKIEIQIWPQRLLRRTGKLVKLQKRRERATAENKKSKWTLEQRSKEVLVRTRNQR